MCRVKSHSLPLTHMNIKSGLLFLGLVLTAMGVVGFFNNPLVGLFEVDALQNIIYLVSGVVALFVGLSGEDEEVHQFSKVFGFVYAILGVVGLIYPGNTFFGFMINTVSSNVLHIVLGAILLGMGYARHARLPSSSSSLGYRH